jgi:23S rRNA (adenine2030-N6)-methyltransferase
VNYRHSFHAGNFADVHKHVLLLALLDALQRKPTPLFYLDTHAGSGLYDLNGSEAQRGAEAANGIGRLLTTPLQSAASQRYVASVRVYLDAPAGQTGRHYPGSPLLALDALRAIDRVVLIEKQERECDQLREHVGRRKLMAITCGDGYQALKAHLPPKENRGLVLIDPPFEQPTEFTDLANALKFSLERWPTGMFAAWYPIKTGQEDMRFLTTLRQSGLRKLLFCELCVRPRDAPLGLNGSGLLIANPPWKFETEFAPVLAELQQIIAPEGGESRIDWLVGE